MIIDLQPAIRSVILNDSEITSLIANYSGSEAIFTRRPVPQESPFPLIIISPIISNIDQDYLLCNRQTITHDIYVYGLNDNSTNYRNVEKIGIRLHNLFHRMQPYSLVLPVGNKLIQATASAPISAPVDDENKTGRVVIVNFEVSLGN